MFLENDDKSIKNCNGASHQPPYCLSSVRRKNAVKLKTIFCSWRYKNIINGGNWKNNANYLFQAKIIISGILIYLVTIQMVNAILDLQIFNIYNVCLCLESSSVKQTNTRALLKQVTVSIPTIIMVIVTVMLDITSYLKMSLVRPLNNHREKPISKDVMISSFQITVINSILVLPYGIYVVVIRIIQLPPQSLYFAVLIPCTIINLIRNPISVYLASRYSVERPESTVNWNSIYRNFY